MSLREWKINKLDISNKKILEYCAKWKLPYICVAILYSRNFRDFDEINKFINPEICYVNPFEFKYMTKAVNILKNYIENNQKICIYGDYDADGVTATALIYNYFTKFTENIMYYIPDRETEGYGLNINAINKLKENNVNLIITVDNGISAYNEIKYAYSLGIKAIITDHHKVPEILPKCEAIIDPCLENVINSNWNMKYRNFAGVGVAYKFVEAFNILVNNKHNISKYQDLVALGSIGDSMELFGETRFLVKNGLNCILNTENLGIKNLVISNINLSNTSINSIDVAFKLVPKINSSGRIESPNTVLKLFISNNNQECVNICDKLYELNNKRKEIELEILQDAKNKINNNLKIKHEKVIVLVGENWHPGVIGIVASRILEYYGKPCILISQNFNNSILARGSCRSIENFSIYELISSCSEYLENFGGHTLAAGMSLKQENINNFCNNIIKKLENIDINFDKLKIDLELKISDISINLLNEISLLEPFGNGNPEPVFVIKKLILSKIVIIGNGNHMRLLFFDGKNYIDVLCFNKKINDFLYNIGEILDVVVNLSKNMYKNNVSVSVYCVDMKISDISTKYVLKHKKIYEKFMRNECLSLEEIKLLTPDYNDFIKIYKYFGSKNINKNNRHRVDIVSFRVYKSVDFCGKIWIILDVLVEFGLADVIWYENDEFEITLKTFQKKVKLSESKILKKLVI